MKYFLLKKYERNLKMSACAMLITVASVIGQTNQTTKFTEVYNDFPRQEKNLRKWDAPVVADLDQDGFLDLLINDHGYAVQVCWNNNGKFAKPHDIIMGDLHGISVGDFDKDGNLEVVMSRGGGSGGNARNSKMYRVTKDREFVPLPDFKTPLALMRGRTVKFVDVNNDGDLDLLNFAFPDETKKGQSENYVYENNGNGELVLNSMLPLSKVNGQKVLVTDFNDDNISDIIMYGYGNVIVYQGGEGFTFEDVTKKVLPAEIDEVTSVVELDFDNDGDFDLFFTRGLEFEKGETYFDQDTNTFGFFTKRGEFQFEDLEVGDVLNMENFQSQWPNNDTYYIGESSYDYEFPAETHSGKDIKLVVSDALGFPDHANYKEKKGWYIGYVGNNKWRIAGFLFAPSTGIVHGVKDYPKYNHPEGLDDILLENTGSSFKDVTAKANLKDLEHTVEASVADFDNNGFQDILVINRGDLIHENTSTLYLNNGDSTFEKSLKHNIVTPELGAIGMATETFDYNNDGKVDVVIGNERGKWHLFKNEGLKTDTNKFITVEVRNSKKGNVSPLGALVTVKSCNNSQIQRVGETGAAYSLSHNNYAHFGLGTCKKPVKVKVVWSNGETLEKTVKTTNDTVILGVGK
ncbi:VCBS repeat-containing protein [Formosa sp. PL04]|uniref:FG-GAP repeat domain-containing protein n=1 Tax=Formosa sp. PL04 TaxID=3081755 RepID=UPI0029821A8C|nr:VCBS repeat-containing protein [Formosa sp. PL04]MDW5288042.1 VCBS repeat-containing protein [Formosa sp. PL04]